DNAVPCGSSVAVEVLLRLAALTGDERYERHALSALRPMADLMGRHPTAFGRFLCALDFHLGPRVEVALVAPTKLEETAPLAEEGASPPRVEGVGGHYGGPPRRWRGLPGPRRGRARAGRGRVGARGGGGGHSGAPHDER